MEGLEVSDVKYCCGWTLKNYGEGIFLEWVVSACGFSLNV